MNRIVERGQLRFLVDLSAGRQLAKRQQKPYLYFFTAEWCTFCHDMENDAFSSELVHELAQRFVCVLVDADREPEVCRNYQVRGYPTIQFFAVDGRPLHRLVGRQSTAQLVAGMHSALDRLAWLDGGGRTLR